MQLTTKLVSFLGVGASSFFNEGKNFWSIDIEVEEKLCFAVVRREKNILGDFFLPQTLLKIAFFIPVLFMDQIAHKKNLEEAEKQEVG